MPKTASSSAEKSFESFNYALREVKIGMDFDIVKEQELIRESVGCKVRGIDIIAGRNGSGTRLFNGNISIKSDGSFKGYGQGFRRRGTKRTGHKSLFVEEFLIGCYAMNKATGNLGLAFYRLANDERDEEEKSDLYWHEPQIIISVRPFMVLDDACTDGIYRAINANHTIGIAFSSQYGGKWKEPFQDFDKRLNLDFGNNRIFAENGIEFCRKIVREFQ